MVAIIMHQMKAAAVSPVVSSVCVHLDVFLPHHRLCVTEVQTGCKIKITDLIWLHFVVAFSTNNY